MISVLAIPGSHDEWVPRVRPAHRLRVVIRPRQLWRPSPQPPTSWLVGVVANTNVSSFTSDARLDPAAPGFGRQRCRQAHAEPRIHVRGPHGGLTRLPATSRAVGSGKPPSSNVSPASSDRSTTFSPVGGGASGSAPEPRAIHVQPCSGISPNRNHIEALITARRSPVPQAVMSADAGPDIPAQLWELAKRRDEGILTERELLTEGETSGLALCLRCPR